MVESLPILVGSEPDFLLILALFFQLVVTENDIKYKKFCQTYKEREYKEKKQKDLTVEFLLNIS